MRKTNLRALGLLWGALALLIFSYMETLVNLTTAVGISAAIILFIYLLALRERRNSKTPAEITDEELRNQIKFWTEGMSRLKNAHEVDKAFGGENLHATKNEIAELTRDYKIERIK